MRGKLISLARRLPAPVRGMLKRMPGASAIRDRLAGKPAIPGPAPGELKAVVYPSTWVHWDTMKQRPQYILESLARAGHPVYFVDIEETGQRVQDGVTIVSSLDHVPRSGVIIYTHFAPVATLLDRFTDPVVVYDILDDLSIFDEDEVGVPVERRVRTHHPTMMQEAAIVMASAPALLETHSHERADLLFIENGVDVRRFAEVEHAPYDFGGVDRPIVGYHGMIARWFDFDLVHAVAQQLPEVSFVIVGPTDPRCARQMKELSQLDNVYRIGELPSSEMPRVVASFDVGMIPFVVDEMTKAVSPLKMYEFLAGGKPVVATPLPMCVAHPMVATSGDPEGFASAIGAVLADGPETDKLVQSAAQADWDLRLAPLLEALDARDLRRVPS